MGAIAVHAQREKYEESAGSVALIYGHHAVLVAICAYGWDSGINLQRTNTSNQQ